MKNLITLILLFSVIAATAQIKENAVCDNAQQIPYSFDYSGFIIQSDQDNQVFNATSSVRIELVEGQPLGLIKYSEIKSIKLARTGFFHVSIGDGSFAFQQFVDYIDNNPSSKFFLDVYLEDKYIGSKALSTVPYAMVANALGGMGIPGRNGPQGAQGPQGPQGPAGAVAATGAPGPPGEQGIAGADGFGIMIMRSTEPSTGSVYVDDGSNTADGQPHLRQLVNGVWVDL